MANPCVWYLAALICRVLCKTLGRNRQPKIVAGVLANLSFWSVFSILSVVCMDSKVKFKCYVKHAMRRLIQHYPCAYLSCEKNGIFL